MASIFFEITRTLTPLVGLGTTSAMDVPLFANTGEALAYGSAISLGNFPMLVRTYFATGRAMAEVQCAAASSPTDENTNRWSRLSYRLQTLREAIEAALEDSSVISRHASIFAGTGSRSHAPAARSGAQGDPATTPERPAEALTDSLGSLEKRGPAHVSPAADALHNEEVGCS
jgi:hypothetical protein